MTWSQENCLIDNHQGEHLLLRPASDGNGDFMAVAMRSGHVKRVRIPYLECVFFVFRHSSQAIIWVCSWQCVRE